MKRTLKANREKIKEAREKIGKSQGQMAIELGIPKSTYLTYEHGYHIPPVHIRERIATKLGVEIAEIYKLDENYLRYKEPEADKTAIKEALKQGKTVAGATLVENTSVIIK